MEKRWILYFFQLNENIKKYLCFLGAPTNMYVDIDTDNFLFRSFAKSLLNEVHSFSFSSPSSMWRQRKGREAVDSSFFSNILFELGYVFRTVS